MDADKNNEIVTDEVRTCLQERYNDKARRTHETQGTHVTNAQADDAPAEEKKTKKKITIEVDEDDPCLKQGDRAGLQRRYSDSDPRFQQQNQTLRCYVMYTDFYRCEHLLGAKSSACTWFKQVFTSICPNEWIRHFDELRSEGKFAWHKESTQGRFPGNKYGV